MAPSLLGPPALCATDPNPKKPKPSSASSSSSPSDPFVDLMVANFNKTTLPVKPPMGLTENNSATYLSTGNPCLDFFFHVVPKTPPQSLVQRLELAWQHNDLTSLKLICHLRGVRGTGKSDKEGFYTAALWLHKHHPKTLACNIKWIADFGYFKDLPELLYRILEGPDVRKDAKEEHLARKKYYKRGGGDKKLKKSSLNDPETRRRRRIPQEKRLDIEMKRAQKQKETAKELRKKKEIAKAKKVIDRYTRDPDFKYLHDRISEVFADHLVSDMKAFNSEEFGKISLAAKWCPSLDSAFDKATLLCESIAKKVFPRESYPEYQGIEDAHYAFRVRDRLRKQVLVPLRQKLELPEIFMSLNEWNSLPYHRVPSVAMTKYKKHFLKHDGERFNEYLGKVERGEAKIAAGALLPHEVIRRLNDGEKDAGQVAELQWKRMVEDLSAKGKLNNCIAVCDVSDSMKGEPMEVCVALGLLLSELCEQPWNGKVITFSAHPELHTIQGDNLRTKTDFIRRMKWGMNTDLQKVFDLILKVAVAGSLSPDKMIKRVFIFSDMEFDEATGKRQCIYYCKQKNISSWDTDYEVIQRKFQQSGYPVPEIVFWNLRDSKATPVPQNQKGVALISGFSKNMMTMFLDEKDIAGPEAVMELAISGPEYKELVIID